VKLDQVFLIDENGSFEPVKEQSNFCGICRLDEESHAELRKCATCYLEVLNSDFEESLCDRGRYSVYKYCIKQHILS
jgi:hypothetical protein